MELLAHAEYLALVHLVLSTEPCLKCVALCLYLEPSGYEEEGLRNVVSSEIGAPRAPLGACGAALG